jgi:4a-hydroxytetrahydrobiopterin dehydratase
MAQVARRAERAAHHPPGFNVYDRLVVDLTTHPAGGITQQDVDMACTMEEIASRG